ncbi:MAG: amino acid ABC transporter ATP-binding protein [Bacteriovoracaceae bacterium]|nr:amino acid ABC transporter ATP-binding protein [Bacteriovoracaceae bacterium]
MSLEISIQGLRKSFNQNPILNGIDLTIPKGNLVCFIGRSGCGKSTLLRCLNGLEVLDSGKISIGGHVISREVGVPFNEENFQREAMSIRQDVGMVFQQFQLFPHLRILENICLAPVVLKKCSQDEAKKRANQYLEMVGMSEHIHKYPQQLSGGQQQRAAIARALCLNPKVILYDEPTSALDPELVDEVLLVMKTLDREHDLTQLVVTHEMRFAREASDTIVYLDKGLVAEEGPPDQLFGNAKDDRTKQFLRKFI